MLVGAPLTESRPDMGALLPRGISITTLVLGVAQSDLAWNTPPHGELDVPTALMVTIDAITFKLARIVKDTLLNDRMPYSKIFNILHLPIRVIKHQQVKL